MCAMECTLREMFCTGECAEQMKKQALGPGVSCRFFPASVQYIAHSVQQNPLSGKGRVSELS